MRYLHLVAIFLIFILLTGCPLDNERPPKQVAALQLPELPESIIQVPLALKSRELKRAFYQEFPNPVLEGETAELKMKLSGKEKKAPEDKNFFEKITDPMLEWADKTFLVSGKLVYKIDLSNYDFWFEQDKFFADITLDLATEVKLKNGVSIFGKDAQLNGSLNCPMQVKMVLEGKIELTKDAKINVLLDEQNALIKFQKVCSSNAIKELDLPELLRPILEPVKKRISKTINILITKQLQKLLDGQGELLSFKSKIDAIATQLAEPVELMQEMWLVPMVKTIFVSPPHGTGVGFVNQLEISVGVKAHPVVMFSKEKPIVNNSKTVDFAVENYKSQTSVYVNGKIPLSVAAQQLQVFLKGYIDNNYSEHGYTIGETTIYPSDEKVVVAIDVLKQTTLKRKATIYLWGVPKYDSQKQEVYLDELAFTAKSKDIILKFAQWMMNPKIMTQLKANARFEISDKLKEVQEQLNSFKIEETLGTLTGKFDYVDIKELFVSETNFEIYLQAKGDLKFDLKLF